MNDRIQINEENLQADIATLEYQKILLADKKIPVKAVISLGGDTDIRGAICGALLGGLYGYSEIPSNWSKTILNCQHVRQKRFSDINTNDLISLALRLSGK